MKPTDIAKIRQLLKEIKTASGKTQRDVFYYLKADKALALLLCPTCNGTRFVQAECEACAIGVSHSPSECGGGKPCPDCQPCKRCGGTGGQHRQVDDPQAGNSHMLTKMQCPLDK